MQGIFHAYYTVALAPAVGALVGIGMASVWDGAARCGPARCWPSRSGAPPGGRLSSSDGRPTGCPGCARSCWSRALAVRWRCSSGCPGGSVRSSPAAALVVALAAPAAYSVQTAGSAHGGAIVTAGPQVAGGTGHACSAARRELRCPAAVLRGLVLTVLGVTVLILTAPVQTARALTVLGPMAFLTMQLRVAGRCGPGSGRAGRSAGCCAAARPAPTWSRC